MTVPLRARILLADDHVLVRRGLRLVLDAAPDLEVVAEAGDGVEAVEQGLREHLDLAVLDVAMPRRTGLQAAKPLMPAETQPKVDALVAAIDPVRQLAVDKAVELQLTEAIIKMATAINLAVPTAQPEATTAAVPDL